jgi:putative membrane protein
MRMKRTDSLKQAQNALVSLHGVGLIGMALPLTFPYFRLLTPYFLLTCFALLALFHKPGLSVRTTVYFVFVALAGFLVEWWGVSTGLVFGSYAYDSGLGPKFQETPLLIGLNWLFLVYASAATVQRWKLPVFLQILLPALFMLVYDLVLEQLAPRLGLWQFEGGLVPLQNYLAWFGLAFVFHALLRFFRIRFQNPLAVWVLVLQFVFFTVLYLILPR